MASEPTAESLGSSAADAPRLAIDSGRSSGRDWGRAVRALRVLIRDAERTDAVFDLIEALDRDVDAASVGEFAAHPDGRKLLEERPDLLGAIADREALAALPEGSLGRAYLEFVQRNGISADGLVSADEGRSEATQGQSPAVPEASSDAVYLSRRGRDCHDLWHVLTGYGTDEAGEVSVLAFTCGQYPSLGLGLIVFAGAALGPRTLGLRWERYLFRAYRRGRRAQLDYAPYEEWLALPLAEARRLADIDPPEVAHPEGVVAGSRS